MRIRFGPVQRTGAANAPLASTAAQRFGVVFEAATEPGQAINPITAAAAMDAVRATRGKRLGMAESLSPLQAGTPTETVHRGRRVYSARASFRIGTSGSASFQREKNSSYEPRAFERLPAMT